MPQRNSVVVAIVVASGLASACLAGAMCTPTAQRFPGSTGLELPAARMIVHDFGGGPRVFLAGDFHVAGGVSARNAAELANGALGSLAAGLTAGHSGDAYSNAMCVHDGWVYYGGRFDRAGGVESPHLARWNGSTWISVGASAEVLALVSFSGANSGLYYAKAGGTWNAGLAQLENGPVHDAVIYNDGSGDRIVAVGDFKVSGGAQVRRVASAVPNTVPAGAWTEIGGGARNGPVYDALVHTDAMGDQTLYIGGGFNRVGDLDAAGLAAWNGSAWSLPGMVSGVVHAVEFFDDGSGEALYIGGEFTSVSGVPAANLARLRNGVWEAVGAGTDAAVLSLQAYDDGLERSLMISGEFQLFDGLPSVRLARLVSCAASPFCPGDTNGDNIIDFTDLNTVLTAYNSVGGGPGYNPAADFDGDGDVDFADLNVAVSAFNSAC